MRITSSGNVGIGTGATSPGVRFVNSGGGNTDGPTFGSGTVGSDAILSGNGLYGLYTGVSNSGHVWQQVQRNDGSTAVYPLSLQTSGGNVLIGTITDGGDKLQVSGNLKVTGQAYTSFISDASVAGSKTLDFNNGNIVFITLAGTTNVTLSNAKAGAVYTIRIIQGGSGSNTINWIPTVKWGGGTTAVLSTAVGAIDIVTLLYDGTNFYGSGVLQNMIDKAASIGATIEILPEETNWLEINYE
jgi:hypothetical protein